MCHEIIQLVRCIGFIFFKDCKEFRNYYFYNTSIQDYEIRMPVFHGAMGCGQKSFKLVWWCHQLLSGFLTKDHLPRVSCQSCRSLMIPAVHGDMGCSQKNLYACMAVPPAPVRVPSIRPLAPSVTLVTSVANDKGDNEMILRLCTDLLAFALQPRKTPENLS